MVVHRHSLAHIVQKQGKDQEIAALGRFPEFLEARSPGIR